MLLTARDGRVRFIPFRLFIVNKQPIFFDFSIGLKIIDLVHFPSISFVFSLNNCSFRKKSFFWEHRKFKKETIVFFLISVKWKNCSFCFFWMASFFTKKFVRYKKCVCVHCSIAMLNVQSTIESHNLSPNKFYSYSRIFWF